MSRPEREDRWNACWEAIKDTSALDWGRSFVSALARTGHDQTQNARGERDPQHTSRKTPGGTDIRLVSPTLPTRTAG